MWQQPFDQVRFHGNYSPLMVLCYLGWQVNVLPLKVDVLPFHTDRFFGPHTSPKSDRQIRDEITGIYRDDRWFAFSGHKGSLHFLLSDFQQMPYLSNAQNAWRFFVIGLFNFDPLTRILSHVMVIYRP